jgi:hypothetical protein
MLKRDAISLHAKPSNWKRFPVFAWDENGKLVTEVDGRVFKAKTGFELDNLLDAAGVPRPRNIYFVDAPDYEST